MVIEWLKVTVPTELREKYIHKDEEIWTSMLASCPGFLGKEVWINPETSTEVILVVRWATREQWHTVSPELLQTTEQRFTEAMGVSSPIVESAEYQLREFPQV